MHYNWRKRAGLVAALGAILLLLVVGLQPLAAQEKGEYPGEMPTAPVPGAPSPEKATEDKPTASVGVDVLSQYVWRGFALSRNSMVLQPSVTVGYKGFSLNVWGNLDTNENAPGALTPRKGIYGNETDFTLAYTREIFKGERFLKSLTVNLGAIYYNFDKVLYPQGDSFEVYAGLVADFKYFKLAAQNNMEVFHYPGNWLTVGISRVFDLPWRKMTLELGNNYIFLFSRDYVAYPNRPFSNPDSTKSFSGPLVGQVYATLNIPVHKYVTISPKGGFWYGLGGNSSQVLRYGSWDAKHNHAYGGVNVTFAF